MNKYTHLGLIDQTAALAKLPGLPLGPHTEANALRGTGTHGVSPDSCCTYVAMKVEKTLNRCEPVRSRRLSLPMGAAIRNR